MWKKLFNRGPRPGVVLLDNGFEATSNDRGTTQIVRWSDVREIRTYKLDEFTCDVICLAFKTDAEPWVEVTERQKGFHDLSQAMEARFPEIPRGWLWDVAVPAFEANETVLYPFGTHVYSRQLAERKAAIKAPRPDSLSAGDLLCTTCAGMGSALLWGTGHPVWAFIAAALAVFTVALGIGLRRLYRVQEMPSYLVDALLSKAQPERIGSLNELLTKTSFHRVVPFRFRALFALIKMTSITALAAALLLL